VQREVIIILSLCGLVEEVVRFLLHSRLWMDINGQGRRRWPDESLAKCYATGEKRKSPALGVTTCALAHCRIFVSPGLLTLLY